MKLKVMSKFFRLKMADDIRKLLTELPQLSLVENQVGNHVYTADGVLITGACRQKVKIRIRRCEEKFNLTIRMNEGLEVVMPFDTEEQKAMAPIRVQEALQRTLN